MSANMMNLKMRLSETPSYAIGLSIRNAKKQIEDLRYRKTYIHCSTGYRGNIATDELIKQGFYAVTLDGGFHLTLNFLCILNYFY